MDDTLHKLLDAERRAQDIVQKADEQRQKVIQQALSEARIEEERFEARIPELHESFVSKAQVRAEQTINELKRRYDEHHKKLREQAEEREDDALEAAFSVIIDPEL
ncbi:MAG: ATPase [Chromatiales bacterium]|jgi:cell division septum initiation protein DivIVA